ncbi:vitamin K epoxide reductase family protein [Flavobacterium gelidilacus]|uniref:vitamin K epoxide reductase family protein n=1 Tax=Flavobacterium gelidilacus TaxID=206041 RepID=UPI000400E603|nr:vitamin K epoxide reductase family protein [Flavobacterium gelidilacus]
MPFKHIDQLPNNFIAELNVESQESYLISKTKEGFVAENDLGNIIKGTIAELEKYWAEVILIIEENEKSLNNKVIENSSFVFPVLLTIFSLITIYNNKSNLIESVFIVLSSIGLFVSVEILKTYFKDSTSNESKFCSANKNFSCKSIISSKGYSFSKYIEFVDLPIVFFSVAFLSQFLGLNVFYYFGLVSLASIPFILYSVYLQKVVLKKWCLLCLITSLLVVFIGCLFILKIKKYTYNLNDIITLISITVMLSIAWFFLKKIIKNSKENIQKLNNLLRFKRSEDVFYKVAKKVENKEQFKSLEKIVIGNKNVKNTITLFLSPSCPHCHRAYKHAIELVEKYSEDLKLEICFNLNINNLENPYLNVAKTILNLYNTNKDCKKALYDWHIENMKLEIWLSKWKNTENFIIENNQIENQFQWCATNELNYAPIKIFNGSYLSNVYEINELFYFFEE